MAGRDVRVLHEEAPHEIVLVADAHPAVVRRGQHQAGVLDGPGGQDRRTGSHGERATGERLHVHPGDMVVVGRNVEAGDVRVQHDPDGGRGEDAGPGDGPEVRRRAVLEDDVLEVRFLERQGGWQPPSPRGHIEARIGELEQDRGLALVLRDVIPGDRPATAGYPLAALEVQRVERPAPSAPAVAAAAEEPVAAAVQWPVAAPDRRARVEALGRELRLEAAALEQAYRQPALAQPIDERDTGRAGPHDAQVARQRRAVSDRARVDLHRGTATPAKKMALLARFSSSRRTKPATSRATNTTAVTTIERMRCGGRESSIAST